MTSSGDQARPRSPESPDSDATDIATATTRRAADTELFRRLTAGSFNRDSDEWCELANRLARYGTGVLVTWAITGQLRSRASKYPGGKGIPEHLVLEEADARSLVNELLVDSLENFRTTSLPQWDPEGGASLATWFINQCLYDLPDVFGRWQRHELRPLPAGAAVVDDGRHCCLPEEVVLPRLLLSEVLDDDLFRHAASVRRHHTAVRWRNGECSYAELVDAVGERARRLAATISASDVALIAVTDPRAFVESYWAVLSLDAVAAVTQADASVPGWEREATHLVGANVVIRDDGVDRIGPVPDWVGTAAAAPALVLLTSGTTGTPKVVVHSHEGLAWGVWNTASIADAALGQPRPVPVDAPALGADLRSRVLSDGSAFAYYSGMPWGTISTLVVVNKALALGEIVVLHDGVFDPHSLVGIMTRGQVQNVALSPFMAQMLLRVIGPGPRSFDGLLAVGLGGARVHPTLVGEVEDRLGCLVTVGYGCTESGGVLTMTDPADPLEVRATTVGPPVGAVMVRVEANEATDGETGRVSCRTPAVMMGVLEGGRLVCHSGWLETGRRHVAGAICVERALVMAG